MPVPESPRRLKPILTALAGLTAGCVFVATSGLAATAAEGRPVESAYFWTDNTDIPTHLFTPNFSPAHFAWLLAAAVLIFAAAAVLRRQSVLMRESVLQVLASAMLLSEISVRFWQVMIGSYSLQSTLPLHLCTISIFLEFAAVFGKRTTLLREFSYALSMPAAVAAVISPGWAFPFISFSYLQYALEHTIQILIPVLLVCGSGFRPDYRRLPRCFLLLLLFAGIAQAANILFGGNYMFLSYIPDGTPFEVFEEKFGHIGYIFLMSCLIPVIWLILYLPWIMADRRRRRQENSLK